MKCFSESIMAPLSTNATLSVYVLDNNPEVDENRVRPAVLICPGGGYRFTSEREAEPIAIKMNSFGYQAFVLWYSYAPAKYPTALYEAAAAVRKIRQKAGNYHVDPDKIIIMGFSAGGHLAADLATMWDQPVLTDVGFKPNDIKPNALALGYPVITTGAYAHEDSFRALLGEKVAEDKLAELSIEKQVTENTVPAFIWTIYDDEIVPVENSLLFAQALKKAGISCELHIFAHGFHGMSLANSETTNPNSQEQASKAVAVWPELFSNWVKEIFN